MVKYLLLLFLLPLLSGCDKLGKAILFDMSYDRTVVIPATTPLYLPIDIPTPEISITTENTFSQHKTRLDLVSQIKMSQLTLMILNPANSNLSFLRSVSIYISTPTLPELKIAWADDIPSNINDGISLQISAENLLDYYKSESVTLKTVVTLDELITSDYEINVHAAFRINAKKD
ncbi:MAG: hypothetical protein JNJ58_04070 [Chitinophagaceae bacterium]|nr:hypothetical protein [Chitinophagaceae bacterium]